MLPVITLFVVPPENLNGGIFPTKIGLSVSKLYFVNSTTVWLSVTLVGISVCADKYLSVDVFSESFSLHDYVVLLYCDRISHTHIIPSGRCHIKNLYCNN